MIHGVVEHVFDSDYTDGFDILSFSVADPFLPNTFIITTTASRNGVELGCSHSILSPEWDAEQSKQAAIADARMALAQLIR